PRDCKRDNAHRGPGVEQSRGDEVGGLVAKGKSEMTGRRRGWFAEMIYEVWRERNIHIFQQFTMESSTICYRINQNRRGW
ncbi:hypothetical protein Dimus_037094, partial [Dionaea muscipula]